MTSPAQIRSTSADIVSPYDRWISSLGVPIHKGFYIEDARTVEVGRWEERDCNGAILALAGQEGVTETRVTEIAPGHTMPPLRFAFDELVYVLEGQGLATVWSSDDRPRVTLEWQKHSLFMLPRNCFHQLANARGDAPARLLHFNYLPLGMAIFPDPAFHFGNDFQSTYDPSSPDESMYSEAIGIPSNEERTRGGMAYWIGNFFPDVLAWDKLGPQRGRGAGSFRFWVRYPRTTMRTHMAVFPSRTYKKGHRHGPGVAIVIPGGEGYSYMWQEGGEKLFIPWHEGSVFVPPDQWFHQHFNIGSHPARYLAFHGPPGATSDAAERARDQIEYPDEDPLIRQTFERLLAERSLTSFMPDQAFVDPNYEWGYEQD